VQNVEDAKRLADLGVDAIVLSNHGGRQLDRARVPFHLLPDVVREVGDDIEVMIDTGVIGGADIVAPIAMGAKFTLVGRASLRPRACPADHGTGSRSQILIEARSMVPRNV
jgi:L-lactate dehydrogenase (cytochrome)